MDSWKLEDYLYAIVGREKGEQGTPHLQGFCHFKARKRLTALKKIFPRAHWEKARGSDKDNEAYCSKEGDVILTLGIPQVTNRTSDYSAAVAAVAAGSQLREVAREYPEVFVRHGRGLQHLAMLIGHKSRDFKTHVIVLTGPPGCGKSRYANELPGSKFYKMKGDWWDGYDHEDIVIIDDFYGWLPFCEMLRLMDRYPHKVPVKGAYVEFTSKTLVITSNTWPCSWYNPEKCQLEAFFRRINQWLVWENGQFKDAPDCMKKHAINY